MKYIVDLEKIEGTNLYKAKGANTLVFDEKGIKNILTPYEESEVDWSKVTVDTKVFVRDDDNHEWVRRYFAKYENGIVWAFGGGQTSWSQSRGTKEWKYAKLAEDDEVEE